MIIELENGTKLEVEDGASPAQIDEVVAHATSNLPQQPTQPAPAPTVSVGKDMALTAGSNIAKGLVDTAMLLPNIANEAVAGPQYLYQGIKDTFQGNPTNRDFKPFKPFFSSEDLVGGSMIDYQPQTTAGKITAIPARIAGNMVGPKAISKAYETAIPPKSPTAADIKSRSQASYNRVEKSGATLDDQVFSDFMTKAQKIRPQGRIQQATGARDAYDEALDTVSKVGSVKNMTMNEVKQLDEQLTNLAEGARDAGMGTPQSRLINELKYTWRKTIDEAADKGLVKVADKNGNLVTDPKIIKDWKSAVKDYATAGRVKDIELIIERAKLMPNPDTGIKTGMRNLYMKIQSGKARGYTKEQTKAIYKASKAGLTTGISNIVGSRFNPIIALSTAGLDRGITAAVAAKAGRELATNNQVGRATNAMNLVSGAPRVNPIDAAWFTRNQAAAQAAAPANVLTQTLIDENNKKAKTLLNGFYR